MDFIDINLYLVHELDAMVHVLGYVNGETLYYYVLIPDVHLVYSLLPLGNDQDMVNLSIYVVVNKIIKVYFDHGQTRVHTNFISPFKFRDSEVGRRPTNIP